MNILSLTKSLISIPSVKDNTKSLKEALDIAKKELTGFTIEEFESNKIPSLLVYSQKNRPKKFKIILNAHLDVVPGKQEQFLPVEKNGKLYGRGAYDMKAAAAAIILVFKEITNKLNYSLGLQLVTDEEIGGVNGTGYQIKKGVNGDFVISGERSDLMIRNEAKGIVWAKLIINGKTAHGAYPWLGDNALVKANQIIEKLLKRFPIPKNESWTTTVNIAKIETSNQTFNKLPSDATISLDIRYIPKDKEKIIDEIKKCLFKDTKLEIIEFEPPVYADKDNLYLKKLSDVIEKNIGKNTQLVQSHGASDARYY